MVWPTDFDVHLDTFDKMEIHDQQLAASHADSTLDYVLNLDFKAKVPCQRLTGIMAEVGKSTANINILEKMITAGMNIALINVCFGTKEEHQDMIKMIKQAAKNVSARNDIVCPLSIALQLAGKKIRTGRIAETYGDSIELKTGEVIRVTSDETYRDRCSLYTLYVDYIYFAEQMKKGDYILIDNEAILLKVEAIAGGNSLTCRIERGGILVSYRDVFVPNVIFNMPSYSERDKQDIEMAVHHQIDIIIATFAQSPGTIKELRVLLGEKGKKIAIVACIQNLAGYINFGNILPVVNGVMITRQELGSDLHPNKIALAQKNLIARANVANVPVCLIGYFLTSMQSSLTPRRSEVLDISNCILDGCDALALTGPTAVGEYPVETVALMSSICKDAEACMWSKQVFLDFYDKSPLPCDLAFGISLAAVIAAQRTIASCIVTVTATGKSAQVIAMYRPRCPIIAVTRYAPIARQLHLYRGILPLIYERTPHPDWHTEADNRVYFAIKWAMAEGFVRDGDPVIALICWHAGPGITNTLRTIYASADASLISFTV